jgi:hypothetical protein
VGTAPSGLLQFVVVGAEPVQGVEEDNVLVRPDAVAKALLAQFLAGGMSTAVRLVEDDCAPHQVEADDETLRRSP